ncbi:MAG: protease complex subunit PrcB family protein [Planctomycetes bacterium]|nr:protease complex subunit PrcB family protein [Planctomycetota bacterium]
MWLAAGALAVGALLAPRAAEARQRVWFEAVAQGVDGPRGEPFQRVLRSVRELRQAGLSKRIEREVTASVDFKDWMVLVVSKGRCQGRGHSIEVAAVERRERPEPGAGQELVVIVRTVSPAPASTAAAVTTAPYHVVRLRATTQPIRFEVVDGAPGDDDPSTGGPHGPMTAESWEIGPVINGKNYSLNMPLRPTQDRDRTWYLEFGPDSGPHYVTFPHGSLVGKSVIRGRFKIEGAPGTRIWGKACPDQPSSLTFFFMSSDPDWYGDGGRWWATFATKRPLEVGTEFEVVARLDANWTSVLTMSHESGPREFEDALANADRVGFTFGDCESFGHGARATATVRFRVLDFRVE